jgi:hypothetical protein
MPRKQSEEDVDQVQSYSGPAKPMALCDFYNFADELAGGKILISWNGMPRYCHMKWNLCSEESAHGNFFHSIGAKDSTTHRSLPKNGSSLPSVFVT